MKIDRSEPIGPLFIVGSPRSGTSVLVDAAFAAGFRGFREGNFLALLEPLRVLVERYFGIFGTDSPKVLISHLQAQTIYAGFLEMFRQKVEELNPDRPWVDKTCNPPIIKILPDLVSLWPDCRIIFAKRRGIENIRSRMKKFPSRDFSYHCGDWAATMSAWREVRDKLDPWRYREIDQRDLLASPDAVAGEITALLELNAAAQRRMAHIFVTLRPQQTAPGTAEQVGSLDDGRWDEPQVQEFLRTCGVQMECFGYTLDASYRK
jgi:hypothetical protein